MANEVAYGFITIQNRFADRVTSDNMEMVMDAVTSSFEQWNTIVNAQLNAFCERTIARETKVWLPASGMLEPLNADANPTPRRYTGSYEVGYPIWWWGTAYGQNREERVKATIADYNRYALEQMKEHKRRIQREILKATLYDKGTSGWTFTDQRGHGSDPDVTVRSLANGDAVSYVMLNGNAGTDNHYIVMDGTFSDANYGLFSSIYSELREHPSNRLSETGYCITWVASDLVSGVENLTALQEPKNDLIIPGISSDRVVDLATLRDLLPFGEKILGVVSNNLVVEWSALPGSFTLSLAPSADPSPLRMREEPEATLQGLFAEYAMPDGNHLETRMLSKFGIAPHNRVAMVAGRTGTTSYTNPDGYDPSVQA
jgi:hypothetical protein